MYITHTGLPDNGPHSTQAETPDALNGTSDINFFNAQLSATRQPVSGVATTLSANLFSLGVPESTAAAKRVQRGIRDTLSNKQTKQAHALPEALAAANLGVVAQVKVVGLLVKGIDKIATMG
ncbi:hypothetical protein [Pseudomonas poae]|uniref:Uncharacterized protein n=1 Tax=Pseudomonas poae TaxID=200451 RepID=A0A2S9EP15_9PSED|nr:hypothetical protein [Pseudomonas poae]PRA26363.1 hypothetical protein CQZ97_20820 [Pseudomonas poae]PRC17283.1 hypothetical protein CQZ99_15175 [Pseudomonas poae]